MAGTLRITGGVLARRLFKVPKAADKGLVRPTTDRVREAVFSSLGAQVHEASILDLFAGSGAYGFECLSRGAKSVCFVEKSRETAACVRENMMSLGLQDSCRLIVDDATRFVGQNPFQVFDLIFCDPPYGLVLDEGFWALLQKWLRADGVVVFRCKSKEDFVLPKRYRIVRERSYGGTIVFFLENTDSPL